VHISVRVIMATDLCICSAYFVNPGFLRVDKRNMLQFVVNQKG